MGLDWKGLARFGTHAWHAAAIACVSAAVVFAASHATSFSDFDGWTYDFTVMHAGLSGPSKDIVFVDFDEDTFARVNKYPIPRSMIADVVDRIGAQKPRVVGLDIFLDETRDPAEDRAMQAALTSAGVVVIVSQESAGGLPPVKPLPMFCQPEEAAAESGFCKEGEPGAMGYAFANLPFDADGFIRQGTLFSKRASIELSFPVMLAQQYTGKSIEPGTATHVRFNGHNVYVDDQVARSVLTRTFLIGSWGREPATVISAWKLLAGVVPADAMTGKLVLVGQSNDAAHDRVPTPLFRVADNNGARLRMPGTQVMAAQVRSLIEGTVVRPAAQTLLWAWVLVGSWIAAMLLLTTRSAVGVVSVVVLCAAATGLGLLLYAKARFWLPFFPMQMGVAVTLPLTLGLQFVLEQVVARQANLQRTQMMSLFSSYVDPAVANTIWERRDELSLGGEERVATVMFTDIRSFTALSAGKPPAEVLKWLNQYMSAMDEVIRAHGGFLNKFIGDGSDDYFWSAAEQGCEGRCAACARSSGGDGGAGRGAESHEFGQSGDAATAYWSWDAYGLADGGEYRLCDTAGVQCYRSDGEFGVAFGELEQAVQDGNFDE